MSLRRFRRATTLAIVGVLAFAGVASADAMRSDGDALSPGNQTLVDLGEVAPSAVISVPVEFELACAGLSHPDPGQSVTMTVSVQQAPSNGAVLSVTSAVVGPVPAEWPADDTNCPDPIPLLRGTTSSTVTLRAPSTPNFGYMYTVAWSRSLSPAGGSDSTALSGTATAISFRLAVVANAAPVLVLPADLTVEGDTAGGWTAQYVVGATDAEDEPDPVPTCSPATGEVLPLGTTTVACSVTDAGGRTTAGSFDVTVVDTTAPAITVGDDQAVTTADPAGTTLAYDPPVVADVVDGEPDVECVPAAGSAIAVGTTTVTCTATDASGNSASDAFDVVVTYVAPHVASVAWLEPVGASTEVFVANRGRTVPVKALLSVDGEARSAGAAQLTVTPCGRGDGAALPMTFGGGRWNAALDTSALVGGCHEVTAWIDGLRAGAFELDLRGTEPTVKAKGARSR